jgi:hypothetical protein
MYGFMVHLVIVLLVEIQHQFICVKIVQVPHRSRTPWHRDPVHGFFLESTVATLRLDHVLFLEGQCCSSLISC